MSFKNSFSLKRISKEIHISAVSECGYGSGTVQCSKHCKHFASSFRCLCCVFKYAISAVNDPSYCRSSDYYNYGADENCCYHYSSSFLFWCSFFYQRTVTVTIRIPVRHTAAIPQSNISFPPLCLVFLFFDYSISHRSWQHLYRKQWFSKDFCVLWYAQKAVRCFVQNAASYWNTYRRRILEYVRFSFLPMVYIWEENEPDTAPPPLLKIVLHALQSPQAAQIRVRSCNTDVMRCNTCNARSCPDKRF